jgi:large subunit ribosomal protein L31
MKQNIHPKYYDNAKVTCACGNTFETGSILAEIKIDICAACHPFFTGEQKYVDTLGRVERFKQRQLASASKKFVKKADRKKLKEGENEKQTPKSLKEMLQRK